MKCVCDRRRPVGEAPRRVCTCSAIEARSATRKRGWGGFALRLARFDGMRSHTDAFSGFSGRDFVRGCFWDAVTSFVIFCLNVQGRRGV